MDLARFYKVLVLGGALAACGAPGDESRDDPNALATTTVADAGTAPSDAGTIAVADAGTPDTTPDAGRICPWAGMDPCTC